MMGDVSHRRPLLLQLARPQTAILLALHLVLAHLYLGLAVEPGWRWAVVLALVLVWYAQAVAVNDLSDLAEDEVNLRHRPEAADRPLLNSAADRRRLVAVAVGLAVVALGLAALLAGWLVAVTAVMLLLNLAYSVPPVRVSSRGALSQLVLPIGYVGFPAAAVWAAGGVDGPPPTTGALGVLGLYLVMTGRLFLKDVRDVVGDTRVGKRTFLVRHGLPATALAAGAGIGAGTAVMLAGLRPASWVLLVALLPLLALMVLLLRRLVADAVLARRVLWVGAVGRLGSTWTFACTAALAVTASGGVEGWQREVVAAMALLVLLSSLQTWAVPLRRAGEEARVSRATTD